MGYAEEKAASDARKAAKLAEADAVFQEWYQNVEERVREVSGGLIQYTKVKHVDTNARCWCGRATLAVGLCKRHYEQWWNGVNAGRNFLSASRIQLTDEERQTIEKNMIAAWRFVHRFDNAVIVGAKKNAWKCIHTDRPHNARGLCKSCYQKWLRGTVATPRIRSKKRKLAWRCAHTDRPHKSRGLCHSCATTAYRHRSGIHTARVDYKHSVPLKCGHPYNEKYRAMDGWCPSCYWKRRAIKEKLRRKTHYYIHPPGTPLLCGHDAPHNSKGCCRPCYKSGVWKRPDFFFERVLPALVPSQ